MSYLEIKTEGIPRNVHSYTEYPDVGIYSPEDESFYVVVYRYSGMQTGLTVPKKSFEEIEFEKPASQTEQVIKANDIATILAVALHKDAAERFVMK